MEKITLTSTDIDGCKVTFDFAATTWGEVAEQFYLFLLASGYVLEREQLADYFNSEV